MYHIHERSFLKIILCCSLLISVNAFAEGPVGYFERVEVYDDGRYKGIRGINKSTPYQHGRVWQGVFDSYTGKYTIFDGQDLRVRHAKTGLTSSSKVAATIEATVSRQSVLSGAFGLVKKGAKLAVSSRGNLYLGGALFAYEAYQAVKGDLESQGYYYDEAKEEFYKEWPARNCIWFRDQNNVLHEFSCYRVDSSVLTAFRKGGQSYTEAEQIMNSQMEKLAATFWEKRKKEIDGYSGSKFWEYFSLDKCVFNSNGGYCYVKRGNDIRSTISFSFKMREKEVLDNQKFLQIATPSIDSNPTPFVEGTGRTGYSEDVKVLPGTVVTLGPATGEDGKPFQMTINFKKDKDGKTVAIVTKIPRPDLTPGSHAAPKITPNDKPDPDGKEDRKKDERPKEDDRPKEDGGLLCKVFPNILACDELPEKEEPNLEIPKETIDLNFTPDNTFSEYGECPAPVTFQALGTEYKISLEPACNLAAMMRPFIIAMAWLVASFFVARVVRNNA